MHFDFCFSMEEDYRQANSSKGSALDQCEKLKSTLAEREAQLADHFSNERNAEHNLRNLQEQLKAQQTDQEAKLKSLRGELENAKKAAATDS